MQEFALDGNGPKRLRIAQVSGDVFRVQLDGVTLREVARAPKLEQTLQLPDGSNVVVVYNKGLFDVGSGWNIVRDGAPLPGSVSHPDTLIQTAAAALFAAAALKLIATVLFGTGVFGLHASLDMIVENAVGAVLLALCGWGTLRKNRIAFFAGVTLFVLNTVVGLAHVADALGPRAHIGLTGAGLIHAMLLIAMVRAVPVMVKKR